MIVRTEDFATHVAAHAGISAARATEVTVAVLKGIGIYLSGPTREFVAEELPPPLAAAVLEPDDLATTIEERVLEPGATAGEAREIVASVCRVLAEELSTEAVSAIHASGPVGYAQLFATPSREQSGSAGDREDTLATGQPGSRHPIVEARPERTQTNSIAADNPHDATKLSSAAGTTQERSHETLAEGHEGDPERSLAGSRG